MKKISKLLTVSLVLTGLMFFSPTYSKAAGGCGTFYIYKTSTPSCYTEHCGIWDSTALVQWQYEKRQCVRADNTTYWEYQSNRVHIDCGC